MATSNELSSVNDDNSTDISDMRRQLSGLDVREMNLSDGEIDGMMADQNEGGRVEMVGDLRRGDIALVDGAPRVVVPMRMYRDDVIMVPGPMWINENEWAEYMEVARANEQWAAEHPDEARALEAGVESDSGVEADEDRSGREDIEE